MTYTGYSRISIGFAAVLLAAFALVVSAPRVDAQVLYGTLIGTIQDESGAVVPGANVTIASRETGLSRETTVNAAGQYSIPSIPAGTYDLTIAAAGFSTHTQEGVAVNVNTVQRIDVTLRVGQVTETVTVEASTLTLQTDTAVVRTEIDRKEITSLPLPRYRNYQSLLNLVPGATPGRYQNANTDSPARALSTNVNGVNRNNNNTKIDGTTSVFIWLPHHTAYVPSSETIDVVNVSSNSFDAEQGMAGGAAITVQTKSGTNEIHGSAFAFHDNGRLAAKDFFFKDENRPKNLVNIDGFTLGGPVVKDKLFYFGGWEGTRERISYNRLYTIPTAPQRQGDFSSFSNAKIYDPATGANPRERTQFENNIVPLARHSSITRKMQDLIPDPNQPGVTNNFFNADNDKTNRDQFDIKMNWNRNATQMVWGKYSIMDAQVSGVFGLGEAGGQCLCAGGAGTGDTVVQSATIGQTKTFSPTFLYDSTIGWTRMGQFVEPPDWGENFGSDVLGIPGTNGPDIRQSGKPRFEIQNYSPLGNIDGWEPIFRHDTTYTTTHNFTLLKGSHDLRFGFEVQRHWLNHWQPETGGGPRGRINFTNGVTSLQGGTSGNQFNSWAGFLLGLPNSTQKSLQWETLTGFEWQIGTYIRDRWQVTPKLTLTLGVRWEKYPLMTRAGRGGLEDWDPETNLVALGGAGSVPKDVGIQVSNMLFGPRLGIAYRVNNNMVIRTGYGITIDPYPLPRPLRGAFPITIANDFNASSSFLWRNPIEQGIPDFAGPAPGTEYAELPVTTGIFDVTPKNLTRGYVQSWNFIIEQRLPGDFITSIGYVGTQQTNAFSARQQNWALPGTGSAGQLFYPRWKRTGSTTAFGGQLSSNYHSLQISINRRAAEGLTLKGAFTYSKVLNMTDDDGGGLSWNLPDMRRRNYAEGGFNQPLVFQMGFVYDLPFGPGRQMLQSGIGRWILGDWQLNGTFSAFQNRPFTVTASGTSLNAPNAGTQTADQVGEVRKIGTLQEYYNKDAWAQIRDVRFGSGGRNILRGPSTVNLDMSFFRDFPVSEKMKLQFRGEFFNISNTPHFNNPDGNANSGSFMQITSTYGTGVGKDGPNRSIRFGLRLFW
jgi:hypothetical protein